MKANHNPQLALSILAMMFVVIGSSQLFAATLCVNRNGGKGCYSTISEAVTAAAPWDTIQVAPGTYNEEVSITKPLSLVGQNEHNTIINATGLPDGIDIDGHGNAGLGHVLVSGFTVENADFAGILVTNASAVSVAGNIVQHNDKNLSSEHGGGCPGLPSYFQSGEAIDCGEGIQLSGVDHSSFVNNTVENNAGGILVADDTGATHDNVITGNVVEKNVPDCGITLASHSGSGVFHNTVSRNVSIGNGGAGVGIFAPGPGTKDYANVIVNNRISNNGQPGVTMHNHAAPGVGPVPAGAPPVMFSDNVIIGNTISGNAADLQDAATSGPTGINLYSLVAMPGTIIDQNTIRQEKLDIAVKVPASSPGGTPDIQAHLNDLAKPVGVLNAGAAGVDGTANWWGCPAGPGAPGCSTVAGTNVLFNPWLTKPLQAERQ